MKIMQSPLKKHKLSFDQHGWNDIQRKILGVREQIANLSLLMKQAGIREGIDVNQLLKDPYRTLLPHLPENFQALGKALSNPALLKWDLFDGFPDIISWAQKNLSNVDLLNYHRHCKLDGSVDETKLAELKESCTRYTHGEKQARVFSGIKEIVERLNALQLMTEKPWLGNYDSGTETLAKPFKRVGTEYVVNEDFIRTFKD